MGGPNSGLEVCLSGKRPSTIRTFQLGNAVGLLFPLLYPYPLCTREALEGWHYLEFESNCYALTNYVTTAGLVIYEWVTDDKWTCNGRFQRKNDSIIDLVAVQRAEF